MGKGKGDRRRESQIVKSFSSLNRIKGLTRRLLLHAEEAGCEHIVALNVLYHWVKGHTIELFKEYKRVSADRQYRVITRHR